MTGHKGNSEFCFPETLNVPQGEAEGNIEVEGKQNSLFPAGPVIKCLLTPNFHCWRFIWIGRQFSQPGGGTLQQENFSRDSRSEWTYKTFMISLVSFLFFIATFIPFHYSWYNAQHDRLNKTSIASQEL